MLRELDSTVSVAAEVIARKLTRRRILASGVKAVFGVTAAGLLGTVVNLTDVFAAGCSGPNLNCTGIGTCPNTSGAGCPSNCTVCINGECSGCPHSNGTWEVGCGICGLGTRYCTDCKCPSCSTRCTCSSICFCSNCCSPAEVRDEITRRLSVPRAA